MTAMRIDPTKLRTIKVLYEDDDLLAVSKPPGMSVHGGAGESGPTLVDYVRMAYDTKIDLHLAHRLDRPTSGIVLLAKSPSILKALQATWDEAKKTYLAIVLGEIHEDLSIDLPLEDKEGRMRPAMTRLHPVAVLSAVQPATMLVSCTIETGRTHQIRLHLAGRDHPVMMDDQHGNFAANKAWSRAIHAAGAPKPKHLMLHALRLSVRHPTKTDRVRLSAEPPATWAEVLRAAGRAVDVLHEVP
jgi:23S rRNA pseudouridine955/2504/2580 synthase